MFSFLWRTAICAVALHVAAAVLMGAAAHAQTWPSKPIRFVIGFPPGGGTDAVARLIAQKIPESWGVQAVVDNRPGGAGMVAADIAAKARPDGYAFVIAISSHVVAPSLYRKVPFDPLADFTPVMMLMRSTNVITVHPSLPARTVKELVALARLQQLAFGSAGIGSSNHLTGEMFKIAARIDMAHVPYKGGGPAVTDSSAATFR